MSRNVWNPKEWSDEAKEWLLKPINKELLWDEPHQKIASFLNGEPVLPGLIASKLTEIATWYSRNALASSLENCEHSLMALNTALQYRLQAYKIFIAINGSDKRPRKQGKIEFNAGSIWLARLICFGHFREAETLADGMIVGLNDRLFYGIEFTTVAPFILDLYASWKGVSLSLDKFKAKRAAAYDNLLSVWRTEDLGVLMPALLAACDYHVERSRSLTDDEYFEFDWHLDRIHPAEILALLRLRQSLGLTVPEIDHPVMATPIAMLGETIPFGEDQMLQKVCEALGIK